MGHKGHWGEYTGNAKWSRDHAHTKVTSKNYDDAVKDDAAHIDYLKRDVMYDDHHGHSDENMTADEKHISKLAGDMKYDKEHHGSPSKRMGEMKDHGMGFKGWEAHKKTMHGIRDHGGPNMNASPAKNIVGMAGKAAGIASDAAEAMRVKNMIDQGSNAGSQLKSFLKDNASTGKSGVAADSADSILSGSLSGAGAHMAKLLKKNK
jgi:hypothetical protein